MLVWAPRLHRNKGQAELFCETFKALAVLLKRRVCNNYFRLESPLLLTVGKEGQIASDSGMNTAIRKVFSTCAIADVYVIEVS